MAENFFHMCFGKVPSAEVVRAFDVSLILYAEHCFNASTFTVRVITSTPSDIYSAVTGGIGSLKGPLHGGANEAVMHMLKEIGEPGQGRGVAPRAVRLEDAGHGLRPSRLQARGFARPDHAQVRSRNCRSGRATTAGSRSSDVLERIMVDEKNIHPNLDFPAGPAYYLMGFDIDLFTPIFVMSRITGWTAHFIEQNADNRLIRPLSAYTGKAQRPVPLIAQR